MKIILNKSTSISIFLLIPVVIFAFVSPVDLALSVAIVCFGIMLIVLIFNLQRMFIINSRNYKAMSAKIDSIANSMHSLHVKIEDESQKSDSNDYRGRRILEVVASSREFHSEYTKNAKELNYRLGKIVNHK